MGVATRTVADDDQSITTEIVLAIAAARGTGPAELRPPLREAVDPDALDRLLERADGDTTVEFRYDGLVVTAAADGTILISDADGED